MAIEDYRHRLLCYSVLAPYLPKASRRPPTLPRFLRNGYGR